MKDILDIREITYGEFPEISDLNPRFRADSKKVKVTLDIQLGEVTCHPDLSAILVKLTRLLPTLEKHQCGEHLFDNPKPGTATSLLSHRFSPCTCHSEIVTDIAHLMEHVIIDLQSNITRMPSCSGITCGYKDPDYRFDMFVECPDQSVGRFSINFTASMFRRLLESGNLPKSGHRLINIAKYLYQNGSTGDQTELGSITDHITRDLHLKRNEVTSLLQKLKEFGFFDSDQIKTGSSTLNRRCR